MNRLLLPLIIFGSFGSSALIGMDSPSENKDLSRVHTQLSLQGDFIVGVSQLNKVNENITELRLELLRQENDEREAALQARLQASAGSLLALEQRHNTHIDEARNSVDAIAMAMRGMEKLRATENAKTAASIAALQKNHQDFSALSFCWAVGGVALLGVAAVGTTWALCDKINGLQNQVDLHAENSSSSIAKLKTRIKNLQNQLDFQPEDNSSSAAQLHSEMKKLKNQLDIQTNLQNQRDVQTKNNSSSIAQLQSKIKNLEDQQTTKKSQSTHSDHSNTSSLNASISPSKRLEKAENDIVSLGQRLDAAEDVTKRFEDYTVLPRKSDETGDYFKPTTPFGGDYGVKDHKIIHVEAAQQIKDFNAHYFKK